VRFTSAEFVLFLGVVVAAYYAIPHRFRWGFLLVVSYGFYMSWRPTYAVLLVVTTSVSYLTGRRMGALPDRATRRPWLLLSLTVDLGLLAAFKVLVRDNDVLLPVGISFYTFQALSYSFDVYRGAREAEPHLGIYAAYVSFFPQLVAGPIERSRHLLPQFRERARWDGGRVGSALLRILWGFFKKLVIADRLALYVNPVFARPGSFGGVALLVASYLFLVQLYCDFSALTDIAIGSARLLGFDLVENFRQPFFSRSITELWQRWHISLSTWFRDYVYVPLARRRRRRIPPAFDFVPMFVLIGLWHGVRWTFVLFGLIHGTYLAMSVLTARRRAAFRRRTGLTRRPRLHVFLQLMLTQLLMVFSVIFFRARSLHDAVEVLRGIATRVGSLEVARTDLDGFELALALAGFALVLLVHLVRELDIQLPRLATTPQAAWVTAYALVAAVAMFGIFGRNDFIYVRF
jgi:D-alanyl-lipoteichoic acid acyltransferase DltB (MBOAT superfamily)